VKLNYNEILHFGMQSLLEGWECMFMPMNGWFDEDFSLTDVVQEMTAVEWTKQVELVTGQALKHLKQ